MHKFRDYKHLPESKEVKTPKIYHIEHVIFSRGFVGAKQVLKVLNELKDRLSGTDLVSREEVLSISENIMKLERVLSNIDSLTLNRISSSDIIKNQLENFIDSKRDNLLDSENKNILLKRVENSLNAHILEAKKSDTRRKRIIEKTKILRFYRSNSKDISLIFEFVALVLVTKKQILDKMRSVKDESSDVKIEEGFIQVRTLNESFVILSSNRN